MQLKVLITLLKKNEDGAMPKMKASFLAKLIKREARVILTVEEEVIMVEEEVVTDEAEGAATTVVEEIYESDNKEHKWEQSI